jgi:hypothetical protein
MFALQKQDEKQEQLMYTTNLAPQLIDVDIDLLECRIHY